MPVTTNALQLDLLKKILQDVDLSWDANTSLYISLHTADPGATGNQTTNEATYTSYARVGVARDATGWVIDGQTIKNDDPITFPTATGGSNTITHVGIGTASSGTGGLLLRAPLSASVSVSSGITPSFAAGVLIVSLT